MGKKKTASYHRCGDCKLMEVKDRKAVCKAFGGTVNITRDLTSFHPCSEFTEYAPVVIKAKEDNIIKGLIESGTTAPDKSGGHTKAVEDLVQNALHPKPEVTKPATTICKRTLSSAADYMNEFKNLKFLLQVAIQGADRANKLFSDLSIVIENLNGSELSDRTSCEGMELGDLFTDLYDMEFFLAKFEFPKEDWVAQVETLTDIISYDDLWDDFFTEVMQGKSNYAGEPADELFTIH